MSPLGQAEVRSFVLEVLDEPLREAGHQPSELPDDFDLHDSGVIDSLGLIEIIAAVEDRFGLDIDFERLDPTELTVIGPLCSFIAAEARTTSEGDQMPLTS